jgi:hypothetical protein
MFVHHHGVSQIKQPVVVAVNSVSTDYTYLDFDGAGVAFTSDTVTITSSGTWTRSLINTGDGTSWVLGALPSTGGNGDTCTLTLQSGYSGAGRSCTLRFTVGTATADVTIEQFGYV